jgi:hypothetical protein
VTLKCPICLMPVEVPDSEFLEHPTVKCPQGHEVPLMTDRLMPGVEQLVESQQSAEISEDITQWIVGAIIPVLNEMVDRLSVDLSEPDLTAVSTAILKAAVAGARQGIAFLGSLEDGPIVTWRGDANFDEWAARFGERESEDEPESD